MSSSGDELERRTRLALDAIRSSLGTPDGEYGATLFASHHLEEIDGAYWQARLGTEKPEPAAVLGLLELLDHWAEKEEDEEDGQTLDFGLPGEVSDYLLSVRFDPDGTIEEIMMES